VPNGRQVLRKGVKLGGSVTLGYLKISNSLLIVVVLLVYSISHLKNMLTALMPTLVNPRSLPIENNIVFCHFCEMIQWFSLSQM
jgi:hypothetical protein